MGRKTWDSIPVKFRPLKGRVNVVLTRQNHLDGVEESIEKGDVLIAASLEEALGLLERRDSSVVKDDEPARSFVIGGSSVYDSALKLPQTKQVLLTKIHKDYDCDTFFPLDLEGEQAKHDGWRKATHGRLQQFVGEEMQDSRQTENGVDFEICLFEKD